MTIVGQYGAKRQSQYNKNPRDALRGILLALPKASEKEHFERFKEMMEIEQDYLRAIIEYWFANNYRSMQVTEIVPGSITVQPSALPGRRAAIREEDDNRVIRVKERIRSILTMSFVMPNGEELRHCTFGYVAALGGVFADISRGRHGNGIVGKHLTDDNLREIQKRFQKAA